MLFYRTLGDEEFLTDLHVIEPLGNELEHLEFSPAELLERCIHLFTGAASLLHERRRHFAAQPPVFAFLDAPHRSHNGLERFAFGEIASDRTALQQFCDILGVFVRAEDEYADQFTVIL